MTEADEGQKHCAITIHSAAGCVNLACLFLAFFKARRLAVSMLLIVSLVNLENMISSRASLPGGSAG